MSNLKSIDCKFCLLIDQFVSLSLEFFSILSDVYTGGIKGLIKYSLYLMCPNKKITQSARQDR